MPSSKPESRGILWLINQDTVMRISVTLASLALVYLCAGCAVFDGLAALLLFSRGDSLPEPEVVEPGSMNQPSWTEYGNKTAGGF